MTSAAVTTMPVGRFLQAVTPGCAGHPHLFFGTDGETNLGHALRVREAKAICAGCPVQPACLRYAHETGARSGVWGGEDFEPWIWGGKDPGDIEDMEEQPQRLCRNKLHLMDAANTWVDREGARNCRACRNARDRRHLERQRQQRGRAALCPVMEHGPRPEAASTRAASSRSP